MKRDLLPMLLAVCLVLGVLATAALSLAYIQYTRKLRGLQVEVSVANRNLSMFQQLGVETEAYGKTNSAVARILEEVRNNMRSALIPPAPPAAKP
ncbi:MAG: hypothetical protein FJ398_18865 [Verrucomicrobia bacterium]|nr:hypothetical protein [Verrucomicrobiota bacterium]